jgi:transposase
VHEFVLRDVARRLYSNGFSIRRTAYLLGIAKSTIYDWICHKTYSTRKVEKDTQPPFVDILQKLTKGNPFTSTRSYGKEMRRFGYDISHTTIHRILRDRLNMRHLKTLPLLPSKNPQRVHDLRKDYEKNREGINFQDVLSVDETSVYSKPQYKKAWATKGLRIQVPLARTAGKRHTLVAALSPKGIVHQELTQGSMNKEKYARFIENIPSSGPKYILMDNVSFHKSKVVFESLQKKGFSPLFVSPYSPDFNPIELYFSWIKRSYRKQMTSDLPYFDRAKDSVAVSLATSWFRLSWNFFYK